MRNRVTLSALMMGLALAVTSTHAYAQAREQGRLLVASEVLEVRPSKSNGTLGVVKVRTLTLNQREEPVQIAVGAVLVPSRSRAS